MFLRFLLVGGLGFAIDAGFTHLLVYVGLDPWLARIPAIVMAATFTWLANRHFTYQVKVAKTTTEAMRYALVALAMALFNYLIYFILVRYFVLPVVAVTIATACQTIVSFRFYRLFVFKEND